MNIGHRLLTVFLLLLGGLFAPQSNAQICTKSQLPTNLQNGLVAFYPFCGNANDGSGNGNNGTVNGATLTTDRFGVANSAYSFNGVNNYISVPNSPSISIQTNFSASAWVLMDGGGCNPRVFEINQNINSCGGYALAVNGTSNVSRTIHAAAFSSCAGGVAMNPSNSITSLQWHQLAYTVNGVSGVGNFYLDGQLVQTLTAAPVATFSYNGNSLTIGNINSGRCDWWGGKLDDLLFYNRVLSACEIAQLYNATSTAIPVNQGFAFNSFSDTTRACGTTATLDAGSGYASYSWNTGATTQSITATTGGFYKVTVTNASGCSGSDSTLLSLVKANIINNDTSICRGRSVTLTIDSIFPGRFSCDLSLLPTSVRSGLAGYFPFCNNILDANGGLSGSVVGTINDVRDRFGRPFHSKYFSGTGYVQLPSIDLPSFTLNAWVRRSGGGLTVISKHYSQTVSNPNSSYLLYATEVSPFCNPKIYYSKSTGGRDSIVSNVSWCDGNWHMLTGTLDGSNLNFYVDGALQGQRPGAVARSVNIPVLIGADYFSDGTVAPQRGISGEIDDVGFWSRSLTQQEVSQLFSPPPTISWSTGATSNSITVSPTQTTTYYVTVSDGITTCTDSVKVTVNDFTGFNPLSDTTRVCGTTTTLNAGSSYASYSWNTGATTQSITPTTTGLYKVTVTNAAGCSASDSTWLSMVKANIHQNDTTVCRNSPVALSVDSLYTALYGIGSKTRSGGYVFYDKGALSSGWRYMEVTPTEQGSNSGIGCYCTNLPGSADSVGAGVLNTQNLITLNCGNWATLANNYSLNGFRNWFIPSKEELNLIYQRLKLNGVGGFLNQPYWTSSPAGYGSCGINGGAWVQNFLNGVQYSDARNGYNGAGNLRLARRLSGQERYRITWSTGDTSPQILVLPNQTTTYYVTISDGVHSCTDSIRITISQPDTSIVALDPPQVCSNGGQVRLQAGIATTYQWLNNNIPIPGALSQLYTATQSGSYRVVVTNSLNCRDTSRAIQVALNPKPIVSFTINNSAQCLQTNYFIFNNTSSITSGSMSYLWRFGDGTTANSASAAHGYTAAGSYTVTLIVTSDLGCTDSVSQTVIAAPSPSPSFIINTPTQQCLNGNSFQFTNTSTISAGNLTAQWEFGDGGTGTGNSVSHSYLNAGSYLVKLRVISGNGCSDSISQTVVVHPKPQVAFQINSASQCRVGNDFQFTNTSTIQSGFMTYNWNFGNGVGSQSTNTNYSYPSTGTYTVKLVAISGQGCKDSTTRNVSVNASPTAGFTINSDVQCLTGNQFQFTNTSTVSSGTMSYNWNFGNGVGVSTLQNPNYTYPTAGTYLVTLDVNTDSNCSARFSRTVIVRPMPVGDLNIPPNTILCEGGTITLSAFGGDSYQWFLNTNQINGAISANYSASQPGVYTVNLINSFGCTQLAATSVTLTQVLKPVVDFSFDSYCLNRPVQFTDLTNTVPTGPVNRLWAFGDGGTATIANPLHTYTTSGSYVVSLQVTPVACPNLTTTTTKTVTMQSASTSIRYPALNAVAGQNVSLSARTFNGAQYLWTPPASLNNATIQNPVFNGTSGQTYQIRITTPAGCEIVDTQQVRVFNEKNIYVPDVFSPNGDGKNDRLTPILIGISQFRFFRVYDRWGQLVFQTARIGEGWDGVFRGTKQPMETYTWVAEGLDLDGVVLRKTGSSILIR